MLSLEILTKSYIYHQDLRYCPGGCSAAAATCGSAYLPSAGLPYLECTCLYPSTHLDNPQLLNARLPSMTRHRRCAPCTMDVCALALLYNPINKFCKQTNPVRRTSPNTCSSPLDRLAIHQSSESDNASIYLQVATLNSAAIIHRRYHCCREAKVCDFVEGTRRAPGRNHRFVQGFTSSPAKGAG